MGRIWLAAAAVLLALAGYAGAKGSSNEQASAAPPGPPVVEVQDEEGLDPLEPILVQGYVKSVDEAQLTLTAPGAPVDLPLSLHEETRYIRGDDDVKRTDVHEGQLVRAALLPLGDDLVALVVEVVPEEEETVPEGDGDGLQGEEPPEEVHPGLPEGHPEIPAPQPREIPLDPERNNTTRI